MAFNLANPIGTGTDAELLVLVRAAIARVLASGQAYSMDGRTLTMADLPALTAYASELEGKIAAADTSTIPQNLARLYRR